MRFHERQHGSTKQTTNTRLFVFAHADAEMADVQLLMRLSSLPLALVEYIYMQPHTPSPINGGPGKRIGRTDPCDGLTQLVKVPSFRVAEP